MGVPKIPANSIIRSGYAGSGALEQKDVFEEYIALHDHNKFKTMRERFPPIPAAFTSDVVLAQDEGQDKSLRDFIHVMMEEFHKRAQIDSQLRFDRKRLENLLDRLAREDRLHWERMFEKLDRRQFLLFLDRANSRKQQRLLLRQGKEEYLADVDERTMQTKFKIESDLLIKKAENAWFGTRSMGELLGGHSLVMNEQNQQNSGYKSYVDQMKEEEKQGEVAEVLRVLAI